MRLSVTPSFGVLGLTAALSLLGLAGCGASDAKRDDAPAPTATPAAPHDPATGTGNPGDDGLPVPLTDLPEQEGALANLEEILAATGVTAAQANGFRGQNVTIAVLDNGFTGLAGSIGTRLPPDTELLSTDQAGLPGLDDTTHGLKMAEIAYAVASGGATYRADRVGPRIMLLNTNGYSNFKNAVDRVIKEKADVVLYAQVWEYGGNLDGKGFINKEVDRAIQAGTLWINAAGNLGMSTYAAPVVVADPATGALKMPAGGTGADHADGYVRFTVPQDQTPVKIVLAWNDFDESKDYRTPQDLNLYLEDANGGPVAAGELIQDGKDPARGAQYSAHAREIVRATLQAGTYRLKVRAHSRNFDQNSKFRITVDGLGARIIDAPADQSVLIPADNRNVLTIGAADVPYSGRGAGKPEVSVPSKVKFTSGSVHYGTSSASAIATGALAVFASAYGKMGHDALVPLFSNGALGTVAVASCPPSLGAGNENTGTCKAPVLKLGQ